MGEYSFYVWTSYGFVFAGLGALALHHWYELKRIRAWLASIKKD